MNIVGFITPPSLLRHQQPTIRHYYDINNQLYLPASSFASSMLTHQRMTLTGRQLTTVPPRQLATLVLTSRPGVFDLGHVHRRVQ